MRTLQRGSTGPEVGLLRRLLNQKMKPSPGLPEANVFGSRYNGAMANIDFGPKMEDAVKTFQRSKKLKDDGKVGNLTWGALGLTVDVSRTVVRASQPTSDTCYAAAATMVFGGKGSASFDPGPTPPGTPADQYWAESFSQQFSWGLEYGMTPLPSGLVRFLHAGPFWFAGNLPFPTGNSYHAVVVGAIWGDGDSDRTMVLIYDPWPVNVGEVYGIILGDYLTSYPEAFRYIIHK
jgi:hypothetical protein